MISEKGQRYKMKILTQSVHTDCSWAKTGFESQSDHTSARAIEGLTIFPPPLLPCLNMPGAQQAVPYR